LVGYSDVRLMAPPAGGARVSRRAFLGATATGVALAGPASAVAAEEGGSATVEVGPNGDLVFTPGTDEPLYVTPGTTVTFTWKSGGHNIVVGSQPDGGNWQGTSGDANKLFDEGHSHEHTFEKKGTYHYWCQPHKGVGMVGDVVVNETGEAPASEGGGEPKGPHAVPVPAAAKSLALSATAGMVGVLGMTVFFMKYGGWEERDR
jgi:plastocyanin